jgi:hypothetical protein
MPEELEGQYASQTVAYLTLFQRVGRSFLGLLLLELGWALVMVLVGKISGDEKTAPRIGSIPLTIIWAYGAILVFIGWAFYSRLYAYLIVCLTVVLKLLVDIAILALGLILILLDQVVLNPSLAPLRRRMVRRWIVQYKQRWIKDNVKGDPNSGTYLEDPEAAWAMWLEQYKQRHGNNMLEQLAAQDIVLKKDVVTTFVQNAGEWLLTPLHSGLRIGIAPLQNYAVTEDLTIARPGSQQFGTAVANLLVSLRHCKCIEFVHFPSLPTLASHRQAAVARRFFNLDALVWGQYTDHNNAAVSTFISNRRAEAAPRDYGLDYQCKLFPGVMGSQQSVHLPALTFSTSDPTQLQFVLLAALLVALQGREARGSNRWDRIYPSAREAIGQITTHLVYDLLPLLSDEPEHPSVMPNARAAMADLVGRWVGYNLSGKRSVFDDDHWRLFGERIYASKLYRIARKCAALVPDEASYFYRLGAISCLLGEKERALTELRRAMELDTMSGELNPIGAETAAQWALGVAYNSVLAEDHLAIACFTSHAASAIASGGSNAIRRMLSSDTSGKSDFEKQATSAILIARAETPVAIAVVEELLGPPTLAATAQCGLIANPR